MLLYDAVIPARHEEPTVAGVVRAALAARGEGQVIVVNDGSRDRTAAGAEGAANGAAEEEVPPCELCGKPMALKRSRFGTFYGCTGYPECKNLRKTGLKPSAPIPTGVPCPECGKGEIVEKRSHRGKTFWSCNRYPDCKFSLWKKPVIHDCPQCNATFLLEKVTKKHGTQYVCNTEGCGYVEDAEPVEATVSA